MNDRPNLQTPAQPGSGLIIAAPASGSGKTVITLGLLHHLSRSGVKIASAKAGPDYIDPAFHTAATSAPCCNLDQWAMRPSMLLQAAYDLGADGALVICEGVMGLFDGAVQEQGSTADLSGLTGWPVVLVIDAGAQGASAGAILRGFATHRPGLEIAGVIFNRIGGDKHRSILSTAAAEAAPHIPVLGFIPRNEELNLPSRHLGLIQAGEYRNLEQLLEVAANEVELHVDVERMLSLARPLTGREQIKKEGAPSPIKPLGQNIAIAEDEAFTFRYPLIIEGWRAQGAAISFFSPLDDVPPPPDADAVYLPGGYPELHAFRLATATTFMDGVRAAAARGATVFGECGGYMVLGKGMIDADGQRHVMSGLLSLETSFAERKLHLGYRDLQLDTGAALGSGNALGGPGARFRGHEFHYATVLKESPGAPLFECSDARGEPLGLAGLADGRVMGSFIHLIDRVD